MGTQVARLVASLLRPVLLAASAGAALSRPRRGILGPFRIVGQALFFIFLFARNNNFVVTNVEMFNFNITEDLVTIFIRRDIYQVACSVVYITVLVGGSYVIYRFAVYAVYKLYTDFRKSWANANLEDKNYTLKLTKEQLETISQIMIEAKASSLKKLKKPIGTQNTSYTVLKVLSKQ